MAGFHLLGVSTVEQIALGTSPRWVRASQVRVPSRVENCERAAICLLGERRDEKSGTSVTAMPQRLRFMKRCGAQNN